MVEKCNVPKSEVKFGGMPEATGLNFFETDPNLAFLLRFYLPNVDYERARPLLWELGAVAGGELDELAREADRHPPEFMAYDKRGERIDEIKYHPSYKRMEEIGYSQFGLVAMSHRSGVMGWPTPFSKVLKYAFWYLFVQSEFGLCCPMSMTDSAAWVLEEFASPELKQKYLPFLTSTDMNERLTAAQFMTEKQGGSDVGANTLTAKKSGRHWKLWGDKWFCSNVSADIALVLARPEGSEQGTKGLAMFLVPKRLENGEHNYFRINRLKDKLGTKDMASGEVTFEGAIGYVVGKIENGFKQMMAMVNSSRLSNAVRSAGMMRRSYLEALVYARGRKAFGQPLIKLPLMKENIFELLLDTEAAVSMIFYTANIFDKSDRGDDQSKVLLRILTPLLKGYICKRARYVTAEAMEVRGGNGYIEEWVNPKLVRDAHLGSIWEGTTNIVALDVLRAITKDDAGNVLLNDLENRLMRLENHYVRRAVKLLQWKVDRVKEQIGRIIHEKTVEHEVSAKRFMERLYHLCVSGSMLEEAEYQFSQDESYRKFFLFLHYFQRYLNHGDGGMIFDNTIHEWLDSVIDWEQIPEHVIEELLNETESVLTGI